MSDMTSKNTKDLIESLSADLEVIKPIAHPVFRVIPWVVFSVIYSVIIVKYLGMRSDIVPKMTDPYFLFEIVLVISMSLSAAIAAAWICVPDMRGQKWMIAVPFSLLFVFAMLIGIKAIVESYTAPGLFWHKCVTEATIFGVLPVLAIIVLTIRGKTTRPVMLSIMNVISVGGLAYAGLRLTCMSDNIGHVNTFHILPYLVFGLLISLIARRLYRW